MIKFIKMSAQGNDYIYLDRTKNVYHELNFSELAIKISDRNFGIGSDGLVIIDNSDVADAALRIFNSDGSEAAMCGSAIRSAVAYLLKSINFSKESLSLETLSGIKYGFMKDRSDLNVSVDMGKVEIIGNYEVYGRQGSKISVGNLHFVVYSENPAEDCLKNGQLFSSYFKDGINVEFIKIINENEIEMSVWERGSGITLACGTGSCAVFIKAFKDGKADSSVKINVPGGTVYCRYDKNTGNVYLEGDVKIIASGEYFWE